VKPREKHCWVQDKGVLVFEFVAYTSVRIREGVSVAHGMAVFHPLAIEAVGVDEEVGVVGTVVKEVTAAVVHATAAMLGLAATPMGEKTAPVSYVQLSIEQRGYENLYSRYNTERSDFRRAVKQKSQSLALNTWTVLTHPVPATENTVVSTVRALYERIARVVGRRADR
jgi:hypothetical protein